jgi:hypothetical protein
MTQRQVYRIRFSLKFIMYFCNRGRENLREIKKTDFLVNEVEEFIELRDMMTKNHKG